MIVRLNALNPVKLMHHMNPIIHPLHMKNVVVSGIRIRKNVIVGLIVWVASFDRPAS